MKSEAYTYKVRGYTFVEHEYDKHMECDVFNQDGKNAGIIELQCGHLTWKPQKDATPRFSTWLAAGTNRFLYHKQRSYQINNIIDIIVACGY